MINVKALEFVGTEIKSFSPTKGKDIVAGLYHDDMFFKLNMNPKHYFRKFKSYGMNEDVFQKLLELGIKTVIFQVTSSNGEGPAVGVYESDMEDWKQMRVDSGLSDGPQRHLPVRYLKRLEV